MRRMLAGKCIPSRIIGQRLLAGLASSEARHKFINFYAGCHGHQFVPSSPIRLADPTLLFVNAGMNQFKPKILDTIDQNDALASVRRAVNSQKCIRAGGKHNDLEDVGRDTSHHTFFEMLGSWSFGDYFKEEACEMALQLLTEHYRIPVERLYFTYFSGNDKLCLEQDKTTRDIWSKLGIPSRRILPFGMKDNFWEMGDVGPCGPCTEIHYDYHGRKNAAELVNAGHKDVVEIWNLVFMQYNRLPDRLVPLPMNHVDTGMGLERITSVLQGKLSNYDTDLFLPITTAIHEMCGCPKYTGTSSPEDIAYRVVSDHVRMLVIAISDGAYPGNHGAELIVRQVLRRAHLQAKRVLSAPDGLLPALVPTVVRTLCDHYTCLNDRLDNVVRVLKEEEKEFTDKLNKGNHIISRTIQSLPGNESSFPVDTAILLHNHYGYPLDLLLEAVRQQNISLDIEKFSLYQTDLQQLKDKGRLESKKVSSSGVTITPGIVNELKERNVPPTNDDKKYTYVRLPDRTYDFPLFVVNIKAIVLEEVTANHHCLIKTGQRFALVLDETSFYYPKGGQATDTGIIKLDQGTDIAVDFVTYTGGYVFHHATAANDINVSVGSKAELFIDGERRQACMRAHTGTHLLNYALRKILGPAIRQDGSKARPDVIEFIVSGPTVSQDDVPDLENAVRSMISSDSPVTTRSMQLHEALANPNVTRMDGEAYPDPATVVSVEASEDSSAELCAGTHVQRTGDIGHFVITLCKSRGKHKTTIRCVTWKRAEESQEVLGLLQTKVHQKMKECQEVLSNRSPPINRVEELRKEIGKLNYEVNSAEISTVCKTDLKSKLRGRSQKLGTKLRALSSLKPQEHTADRG